MNLVIALLSTQRFLTAEKIRATVTGYGDCASDEAFSRMFERDKSELRDLGIPLETGKSPGWDSTEGYRITHGDYALPDIDLTPDEAAAVAVATKLWESPERITAAQQAGRDFTVDWVHLKLNDQAQRTVLCKDPFRSSDERVKRLIASM